MCVAAMLLSCAAGAWQTDSNVVSDVDYPCYGVDDSLFATYFYLNVADNSTDANKAVAFWSNVGDTMNVVVSYKTAESGSWTREVVASFANNNSPEICAPGSVGIDYAPSGEIVLAYGYVRATKTESGVTSADHHIVLKYRNASGWQSGVDILNLTLPTANLGDDIGFNPAPVLSFACASDGALDMVYSYLTWVGGVQTIRTQAFHGNGPASTSFASGTTNIVSTSTLSGTSFSPAAPIFHKLLTSSEGPRVISQKAVNPSNVDISTIEYYANVTTETETELFPVIDDLQSATGFEINTAGLDRVEDIIRIVCDIQPDSETSLTKLLTVAETAGLPVSAAIDNTGACMVAYIEPITNCINVSAEMEAVSPLWVKTPVFGPDGAYFATKKDSSGTLIELDFPVGMTAGSATKLLVMKNTGVNSTKNSLLLLGTKTETYHWSWSTELPISSTDKLTVYPKLAPHGSFVLHSSSTGALLASTP
jgi:hypothetical protein